MVNKKSIIFLALLFLIISSLSAQIEGFFVERRFVQRLSWSGDDYASQYEIIIEKWEEGFYNQVQQIYSTAYQIDISLSPGLYRYRVIPYDFLNRPGRGTEWIEFEVLTAMLPELNSYRTELDLSEIDDNDLLDDFVLLINGNYISPGAEIFLRAFGGEIIAPSSVQILQNGQIARLIFYGPYELPEYFEIIVRNPGGFQSNMLVRIHIPLLHEGSTIDMLLLQQLLAAMLGENVEDEVEEEEEEAVPKERVYRYRGTAWYFSAAYTPLLSLFDNQSFTPEIPTTLSGMTFGLGFIHTRERGFFGWGLNGSVSSFAFSDFQTNVFNTNLAFQLYLPKRTTALRYQIGLGTPLSSNYAGSYQEIPFRCFNTGLSLFWFAGKHFYTETGMEIIYWVFEDKNAGTLRPLVGFGWRF